MPFILHNSGPEEETFYWSGQLWNHAPQTLRVLGA